MSEQTYEQWKEQYEQEAVEAKAKVIEKYGKDGWTNSEVQDVFMIHNFIAGYCNCTRRSDGQKGSLDFTNEFGPRVYFDFR